jgi:NAD(P)H-hydrate epimerase
MDALGLPGIVLMENAARSAVAHALEFWPDLGERTLRVDVLGGPGQNGGDGWAIARILRGLGHETACWMIADARHAPQGDALINFRALEALGIPLARISSDGDPLPDWEACDVLVDAVFGTGLARGLDGQAARALASVPRRPRRLRVLAVDLPSGVSGADGRALGPAPEADLTVSLATFKPGHFAGDGLGLSGELRLGDIGLPPEAFAARPPRGILLDRWEARDLVPARPPWGHKGTFGHAVVAGGSPGRSGALALAATGALRAGAGLVTLACPASLAPSLDQRLAAPMTLALPETSGGLLDGAGAGALADFLRGLARGGRLAALGLGPGLGRAPGPLALVRELSLSLPGLPLVLDADALDPASGAFPALRARALPAVVTPHPGEAARMLGVTVREVEGDRLAAAGRIAELTGAVTVLKGRHTIVMDAAGAARGGVPAAGEARPCRAEARYRVNLGGGPALAAGGSGDLLTGLAAGFLARGMAPFAAASLAVYVHAEAGDLAAAAMGPQGISPQEIQQYIPLALSALSGFRPSPGAPLLAGAGV